MTAPASVAPALHVPEEPAAKAEWYRAVLDGRPIEDVVDGPDGVADWLWIRWRVLEGAALDRAAFGVLALSYRREIWIWLAGERTWAQCCAGLIGRIGRRLPA